MIKKLSLIASTLIVLLIAAFLFCVKQNSEAERVHMMELQQEAKLYEDELTQLRWEYEKLTTPSVDYGTSMVMIGFRTSGTGAEINRIPQDAVYTPVVVTQKNILPPTLVDRCELVSDSDQKISNYRLLWSVADTAEKRDELKRHGYTVCLRDIDACSPDVDGNMVYLNYNIIQDPKCNIQDLLEQLVASRKPLLLIFDLSILSGTMVSQSLDWVQAAVDAGDLVYGSVSSAADSIRKYAERQEAAQAETDARKAEIESHMEDLQAKIDEIYSHWNEVG